MRYISQNGNKRLAKNWWSDDIQTKYQDKKLAFINFKRVGGRAEYLNFKKAEAIFKRARRQSKRATWRDYCSTLNKDSSLTSMFAMARRYRGVSVSTKAISSNLWLNEFITKLAPTTVPLEPRISPPAAANDFEMCAPFSMFEMDAALNNSNDSSAGLDNIPFSLLRNLPTSSKYQLLELFNDFIATEIYPDSWYNCKVLAIRKPGKNTELASSYRPICLLSCPRKIYEKMIFNRLDFWAEKNKVIAASQYGLKKGFGAQDCLAIISTDFQHTYRSKSMCLCVFMDISSAFDDVLIDILCDVLLKLKLAPKMVRLLGVLFEKRVLHFYHNNVLQECRTGYKGLAQGSSLSPLLYNLYTAGIERAIMGNVRILQYADDVAIYAEGKCGPTLQIDIQSSLDAITTSYNRLGLAISPSKTEFMVFTQKYKIPQFQLKINNSELRRTFSFKYLGLTFDPKCLWKHHVNEVIRKCSSRINFIRSVAGSSWGASPTNLLTIYKSTIRPILEYGSIAFQFLSKTHRLKLLRVQWRSIKYVLD